MCVMCWLLGVLNCKFRLCVRYQLSYGLMFRYISLTIYCVCVSGPHTVYSVDLIQLIKGDLWSYVMLSSNKCDQKTFATLFNSKVY